MRIIIIITCTYIPKSLRSLGGFFRLSQKENICIVWAVIGNTWARCAPLRSARSATNYRGSRAQCRDFFNSLGLEAQQVNNLKRLELLWGTISQRTFGSGQGAETRVIYTCWQHYAAAQLGKKALLLINGMMYDTLATQTL